MSPDEVLAEMRDIRLPGDLTTDLPARFAPEPFFVLAVLLALLVFYWWRRRTLWRREAALELQGALGEADASRRWMRLSALVAQIGRYRRAQPPDCLFLPPERIGAAEIELLAAHIRAQIRTGADVARD